MSETIFPMSIDVANGESVTFTMTYDGRVKKRITSYGNWVYLRDDWKFGDILEEIAGLRLHLMYVTDKGLVDGLIEVMMLDGPRPRETATVWKKDVRKVNA